MSEDIKMGDVFELPLVHEGIEMYNLPSKIGVSFNKLEEYAAHAINNHDRLTEHNAKLTADNKALVEALELCHQTLEEFIGFDSNGNASDCMAKTRAALAQAKEGE